MSDSRPQYGEYATPEEQRRLAGLPPLDAPVPDVVAPAPGASPMPAPPAAPAAARPRTVDRILTLALLGYGLVNVVFTAIAYLDLPAVMNDSMRMLGIDGEFTNFAQGRLWGTIASVVLVVGYAATAYLAIRRLRAGRLSWWVPVVGAVATMVVVTICVMVPLIGDPAFLAYLGSAGTP